ncbi:prenyltransferase/squalene oxidase repeat-containing protein [Herbidospora mongoliensis]|uniref:prenyltransferase/squalene oxidase repeat-containing protein n=1 Tax=Herbidospora mongoliensis TaxID=688067 RepID=UPI000A4800E9|nr:prenyltransferase/squalene oxidase repeat-containing protein [Herbidospora mongoliensis]
MSADELLDDLMARPWGDVSPSVYETGRMVTLAPWLGGHIERIEYLCAEQRPDGVWGPPDGYDLVPTLSATEALLSAVDRGDPAPRRGDPKAAAHLGTAALARRLVHEPWRPLPDMPAIELIVPHLIGLINERLGGAGLPLPPGMSAAPLGRIRGRLKSGGQVPEKLLHALEIAGDSATFAQTVLTSIGTVGASPAATAAYLGDRGLLEPGNPARLHLEAVARRFGGPMPVGLPITVFERGWVLSTLVRAGVPVEPPAEMLADLVAAIGPAGTPAGPGLPPDCDTTSVALYALGLLGIPYDPECLLAYELDTHFCTWQGEEGASISTNAHVLDALGRYLTLVPGAVHYRSRMDKVATWLTGQQLPDGSWTDRWHASPFYATACAALALHEYGGPAARRQVDRALSWTLVNQREDGSWGRWAGTPEETAYALQTLLLADGKRHRKAVARGHAFLTEDDDISKWPPLWHDKDLYLPVSIVRAAMIAARHLTRQNVATYLQI